MRRCRVGSGDCDSGGGGGSGSVANRARQVHRGSGNGRRAALAFADRLMAAMVPRGRRRRGVPDEVTEVAHATGGDGETPQPVLLQHRAVRSERVPEIRLEHNVTAAAILIVEYSVVGCWAGFGVCLATPI